MERLAALSISATKQGGALHLSGELQGDDASKLEQWFHLLELHETPQRLELAELDIADGVAATHMLNIVRLVLNRCGHATLVGSPQSLAHNLYRAGLLYEGCAITLIDMREDETYG
jgi:anti-anti-sigma regulatory factor